MPNAIKYSVSSQTLALKKGNFYIGTGDVSKAPTETTDYWNGISPPSGGYTIYLNKATQGPSIYVPSNDSELISLTNQISGQVYSTSNECLSYFAGQTDKMVLNIDYPTIVTSGLVLNLDAGFTPSYPRSGSTWSDVSTSSNNATLFNTPTFSSTSSGILQFDDNSSEYATAPNLGDLNVWTVEVWFRLTTSLTNKVTSLVCNQFNLVNKLNFSVGTNNAPGSYNLVVGFFNGAWRNTTGFAPSTNVWYQVVGTYDGSTIRQYVNGSASGGTLNYVGTPQSGGGVRIMRRWDETTSASNLVDGDLSIVRIYNRALSSTEVLSNFDSTKSRFGL